MHWAIAQRSGSELAGLQEIWNQVLPPGSADSLQEKRFLARTPAPTRSGATTFARLGPGPINQAPVLGCDICPGPVPRLEQGRLRLGRAGLVPFNGVRREQDPTTPHPESRVEEASQRHKWTGENLRVAWRENLRTGHLPALVWGMPGSPIRDLPRPSGDSSAAGERELCQSRWRPTQTPQNSRDRNPGCLGQRRPCSQKPRTNLAPSRSSPRVNTAIDAIYPASKGPPPRGALGLGTQPSA